MSLIFGYALIEENSNLALGAMIAGDTIITTSSSEIIKNRESLGKTSQNQEIGKLTQGDSVKYFAEAACKIGKLNNNFLITVCGDVGFIHLILQSFFLKAEFFKTPDDFSDNNLREIFQSLQPLENIEASTSAEILFCYFNEGQVNFINLLCVVNNAKTIKYRKTNILPSQQHPGLVMGAHHRHFGSMGKILREKERELCSYGCIQQAYALEMSNKISVVTRRDCSWGIGGAILTYFIDKKGVSVPEDTLYIHASKNNVIEALYKIVFRDGYFFIIDFIEKIVTQLAPLEKQVILPETRTKEFVDNLQKEITDFNAKWLFLNLELPDDRRSSTERYEWFIEANSGNPIFSETMAQLSTQNLKTGTLELLLGPGKNFEFKVRS